MTYGDGRDPSYWFTKDELVPILREWLDFWEREIPVMKVDIKVLNMKKLVCENRITLIKNQADAWGILKDLGY